MIDLKPGCKFLLFGPWRDPAGPFFTKDPQKLASLRSFRGPFGGPWRSRRVLWALVQLDNDQIREAFKNKRKCAISSGRVPFYISLFLKGLDNSNQSPPLTAFRGGQGQTHWKCSSKNIMFIKPFPKWKVTNFLTITHVSYYKCAL